MQLRRNHLGHAELVGYGDFLGAEKTTEGQLYVSPDQVLKEIVVQAIEKGLPGSWRGKDFIRSLKLRNLTMTSQAGPRAEVTMWRGDLVDAAGKSTPIYAFAFFLGKQQNYRILYSTDLEKLKAKAAAEGRTLSKVQAPRKKTPTQLAGADVSLYVPNTRRTWGVNDTIMTLIRQTVSGGNPNFSITGQRIINRDVLPGGGQSWTMELSIAKRGTNLTSRKRVLVDVQPGFIGDLIPRIDIASQDI